MIYLAKKLLRSHGDRPSLHLCTWCWQISCQQYLINNSLLTILKTIFCLKTCQQYLANYLANNILTTAPCQQSWEIPFREATKDFRELFHSLWTLCTSNSRAELSFQPMYRSGHPENHLFFLSKFASLRSKHPKTQIIYF